MTKQIHTSVKINASPEKVWKVLMDFENYSKWNSFIVAISGKPKKGNSIKVQLQGMAFTPKIISFEENNELKWLGHFLFKGVFDGEHSFKLIETPDGTTFFEQSESFNGFLVPFLSKTLVKTKLGFETMNQELKARVEDV